MITPWVTKLHSEPLGPKVGQEWDPCSSLKDFLISLDLLKHSAPFVMDA